MDLVKRASVVSKLFTTVVKNIYDFHRLLSLHWLFPLSWKNLSVPDCLNSCRLLLWRGEPSVLGCHLHGKAPFEAQNARIFCCSLLPARLCSMKHKLTAGTMYCIQHPFPGISTGIGEMGEMLSLQKLIIESSLSLWFHDKEYTRRASSF